MNKYVPAYVFIMYQMSVCIAICELLIWSWNLKKKKKEKGKSKTQSCLLHSLVFTIQAFIGNICTMIYDIFIKPNIYENFQMPIDYRREII